VIDLTDLHRPNLMSADDMLAVAQAMEREAAARYATLADCMRRVDQLETAELLEGLAAEERSHVDSVERLAQRSLRRSPDVSRASRALPKTFAREDEATAAVLRSPYRTLSIAVRQEERAFAFWTYVAAQADAALRNLAETFARQELIHAAKLRQARRRAFHAERSAKPAPPPPSPDETTPSDRRGEAARLEAGFAAFCVAAEQQLRSGGESVTADLFQSLADDAQCTVAVLDPTGSYVDSDMERQTAVRRSQIHGVNAAALLFEAAGMIEDIDLRYLEWLETAAESAALQNLEARARAATAQLARINARLYALEPAIAALAGGSAAS